MLSDATDFKNEVAIEVASVDNLSVDLNASYDLQLTVVDYDYSSFESVDLESHYTGTFERFIFVVYNWPERNGNYIDYNKNLSKANNYILQPPLLSKFERSLQS